MNRSALARAHHLPWGGSRPGARLRQRVCIGHLTACTGGRPGKMRAGIISSTTQAHASRFLNLNPYG